jgi:radical SAM protein with 4Fe4S-binding SPASM domain
MFNENNFCSLPDSHNNNWCGGVNEQMLAIDYQGNMYSCIRYMESSLNGKQKPLKLGEVTLGYAVTNEHKKNIELLSNITRQS